MTDTQEATEQQVNDVTGWRIELPSGFVLNEGDVKVAHVSVVCGLMGANSWESSQPTSGPQCLFAWVALAMALDQERDPNETINDVVQLPYAEVLDYIKLPLTGA